VEAALARRARAPSTDIEDDHGDREQSNTLRLEDLLARSQVPRHDEVPGVLARWRRVIEEAPREARREQERDEMTDEDKRPWKKRFVPAERWVLPAKRGVSDDDRDDREPKERDEGTQRADAAPPARSRVIVQAGFGLCVSFVLAACGARDNRPQHVGPPLGDTHVSQGPSDPTVPPPDAADYETPSPGYEITPPRGPSPSEPSPSAEPAPQPAPQPGVFSPPPPPSGPPDVSQPEIPKP
jgi:hypothetical protein